MIEIKAEDATRALALAYDGSLIDEDHNTDDLFGAGVVKCVHKGNSEYIATLTEEGREAIGRLIEALNPERLEEFDRISLQAAIVQQAQMMGVDDVRRIHYIDHSYIGRDVLVLLYEYTMPAIASVEIPEHAECRLQVFQGSQPIFGTIL